MLAVAAGPRAFAGSSASESAPVEEYPLDGVSREVPARGKMTCPKVDMVVYRGTTLRYHKPVRVYAGFAKRLALFEDVVRQTAIDVYGRAPVRVRHLGTYNCRRIRTYPTLISEHGFGNAIDVEGFDFGPARGREEREAAPPGLRGGFRVRVQRHWRGKRGAAAIHARFLRELARRLIAHQEIFRVLLGPSYPGHQNHFHLDVAPYRSVDIFGDGAIKAPEPE